MPRLTQPLAAVLFLVTFLLPLSPASAEDPSVYVIPVGSLSVKGDAPAIDGAFQQVVLWNTWTNHALELQTPWSVSGSTIGEASFTMLVYELREFLEVGGEIPANPLDAEAHVSLVSEATHTESFSASTDTSGTLSLAIPLRNTQQLLVVQHVESCATTCVDSAWLTIISPGSALTNAVGSSILVGEGTRCTGGNSPTTGAPTMMMVNPYSAILVQPMHKDSCGECPVDSLARVNFSGGPGAWSLQGYSQWTLGALIGHPCAPIATPMLPLYADSGQMPSPVSLELSGDLVECRRNTDGENGAEYRVTASATIGGTSYQGGLPFSLSSSLVDIDIPSDSATFSTGEVHDGMPGEDADKAMCEAARVAAIASVTGSAYAWAQGYLDALGPLPCDGQLAFVKKADGTWLAVVDGLSGVCKVSFDVLTKSWAFNAILEKSLGGGAAAVVEVNGSSLLIQAVAP